MKPVNYIIPLILALCSCGISCSNRKNENSKSDNQFILTDKIVPFADIFLVNSSKYLVLIYSPTCLACLSSIDVINSRYNQEPFEIYFVNYQEVTTRKVKDNTGVNSLEEINISSVPDLLFIEDGIIKKEIKGFENIRDENVYIFFSS